MARTCKKGIDYFSHDTSMSNDFKIKMIQAKHGIVAYAIYNKLLEKLYDENGYWLHLSEDVNILFCNENIITIDVYILVLNECINYKLFDASLYEKYSILTNARIQRNYLEAVKRRKQVDIIKEYLLLENDGVNITDLNVNIKDLNVNINPLNVDIGTQTKQNKKETKPKETKQKKKPSVKALELSQHLFNKMLENNPSAKEPNFDLWGRHVDLMFTRDNRTEEQIKYLIDFSQGDHFEMQNILSTSKLRKRFDALIVKVKAKSEPQKKKFLTQAEKNQIALDKMQREIDEDDRRANDAKSNPDTEQTIHGELE